MGETIENYCVLEVIAWPFKCTAIKLGIYSLAGKFMGSLGIIQSGDTLQKKPVDIQRLLPCRKAVIKG